MLTFLLILLGSLAVSLIVAFFLLKKRIAAGSAAKAAAKAVADARLAAGRLRAELDYVLAQIDREVERHEASGDAEGMARRLREIRDVLRQSLVARREPFPVSGPCAEVINAFRDTADGRDLLYSESGDGRWLQVQGDRVLVRWAIGEIFANTAHHAGDWSRVSILAEPSEGAVVLTIRDDGGGVNSSTAARLYSPFTPRFRSPGPGLGLYAVRKVVESLGGHVEAKGALGQGLVHRIRLPHPASGPYGTATSTQHHVASGRDHQSQ